MDANKENKKSILVVDDNDANVMVLSTMLSRLGFAVDEAGSGMEAIDHACRKRYDLIFMDHLMPEMDGVETVKQILFLSNGEKSPIIVGVSATIDEEVVEAFQKVGVSELLEKPVTMEKLEEKLDFIGVAASDEVQQVSEGEGNDIDRILSGVQGLDYKKGLDMMAGSVENYMKVLAVCIKNIIDNYNSIDLIKGTSQPDVFALHFHSLKGIFLNIGADIMAEKSKSLEMASKEGRLEEIQAKLDGYLKEILSFHAELKNAYEQYDAGQQKNNPGKEVSDSEFMQDLEQLRQHIEDFEYIEITETLDKMLSGSQGTKKEGLEKISAAIQAFDYDEALNQVNVLRGGL